MYDLFFMPATLGVYPKSPQTYGNCRDTVLKENGTRYVHSAYKRNEFMLSEIQEHWILVQVVEKRH